MMDLTKRGRSMSTIFSDDEHRILHAALEKERKVCEQVEKDCTSINNKDDCQNLVQIVDNIRYKINRLCNTTTSIERLTKRNEQNTGYYYPECFKKCDGMGHSEKCDNCDVTSKICEKLGAYEDAEEYGALIHKENAVDEGYLQNWYQDSIDEKTEPIWTDEHIYEVCKDFYLIPKNDEKDEIHEETNEVCEWTKEVPNVYSNCRFGHDEIDDNDVSYFEFCPYCSREIKILPSCKAKGVISKS